MTIGLQPAHPSSPDVTRARGSAKPDLAIAAGLFLISCLYLGLFRRYVSLDPDEGIVLQGAQRILAGQVLYRDFFSFFTPGSYYMLALWFKLFDSSLAVGRTALMVSGSLFPAFTYVVARRVCSRWSALLTAYLVIVTALPWRFLVLHNWDSTLWACGALYCALRLVDGNGLALSAGVAAGIKPGATSAHWGWAFATGSFMAVTILFEQSKGAGLLLGLFLAFVILIWLDRPRVSFTPRVWLALVVGLAWPFILTFAYFGSQHAIGAMLADWEWPLHHYTRANTVPYGYQDWSDEARAKMFHSGSWGMRVLVLFIVSPCFFIPALPVLAVVLVACWVRQRARGELSPARAAYYVVCCASFVGLLTSILAVRANIIHFVYLIPLLYLVLAWLMDGADQPGVLMQSLRPVIAMGVFVTFSAVGLAFVVTSRDARHGMETRQGWIRIAGEDSVLPYIQAHLPPGSQPLIYPYLPLYYYLTATSSPVRYDYIQPGMHSTEQVTEVIAELTQHPPKAVLYNITFNEVIANSWPNTPLPAIAREPISEYLLQNYRPCAVLRSAAGWPFLYMVEKHAACPR